MKEIKIMNISLKVN